MEKANKVLDLDGKSLGFAIKVSGKVNQTLKRTSEFIAGKDNRPILFNNIDIALLAVRMEYNLSVKNVTIKLIKYEKAKNRIIVLADYDDMLDYGSGLLQFINNDKVYFVKQNYIDTVLDIRYVVFEDGDKNRSEKTYGNKRQKHLLNLMKNAAISAFQYSGILDSVHVQSEHIVISFKNSSAKIHICSNGNIAKYNTLRKENEGVEPSPYTRCIPFDKVMDKYTTIFCYATKDSREPDNYGFSGDIRKDIEYVFDEILGYLKEEAKYDTELRPKFFPIEFNGVILTKNR